MPATVNNQAKQTTAKDNQAKQTGATLSGGFRDILLLTEDGARLMTEDSRYIIVEKSSLPAINNQAKN